MSKKMLIMNPPNFAHSIYERNLFSKDGLFVMNTIMKDYPEIITDTVDFDYLGLGIFDVFDKLKSYKPDYVYLNLNSYSSYSDFHLVIGIKKYYPYCKIIVGLNISKRMKLELDDEIKRNIDYYLNYDLKDIKIDVDIVSKEKFFSKKDAYKPIYFQKKTKDELINEIKSSLKIGSRHFVFRNTDEFRFNDLKDIFSKTKKHFKFIIENDTLNVSEINNLHKNFGCIGVVIDLDKNLLKVQSISELNVIPFARISKTNSNPKTYETIKESFSLPFIDLISNEKIDIKDFKYLRNEELFGFYVKENYVLDNLKFFIRHMYIYPKYVSFKRHLIRGKKIAERRSI